MIPNVLDLEPQQIVGIYDWVKFYRTDYIPLGKLIVCRVTLFNFEYPCTKKKQKKNNTKKQKPQNKRDFIMMKKANQKKHDVKLNQF